MKRKINYENENDENKKIKKNSLLVCPNQLKNFCYNDTLIDWLDFYGKKNGYYSDDTILHLDFTELLKHYTKEFKNKIIEHIQLYFITNLQTQYIKIPTIKDENFEDLQRKTIDAMNNKNIQLIHNPFLYNDTNKLYGVPDLLIRKELFSKIFKDDSIKDEWVLVELKYRNITINNENKVVNLQTYHKFQMECYSNLFDSKTCVIIARNYFDQKNNLLSDNVFGKVALFEIKNQDKFKSTLESGRRWILRLKELENFRLNDLILSNRINEIPIELFPNVSNRRDSPWYHAKKSIAKKINDLGLLWQIGYNVKRQLFSNDIFTLNDPRLLKFLENNTKKKSTVLQLQKSILEMKPFEKKKIIELPKQFYFYVDFETITNVSDDLETFPVSKDNSRIFLIGLGFSNIETKSSWNFKYFITKELSDNEEINIVTNWLYYMENIRKELNLENIPIIHWSHAEKSFLNHFIKKNNHLLNNKIKDILSKLVWIDLLDIFKNNRITLSLNFSLKSVAKEFYERGLIKTSWETKFGDGLSAMTCALFYNSLKAMKHKRCKEKYLEDFLEIRQVIKYNEVDTKVMWELLEAVRL